MTKILTIGNSFAENATRYMDELCAAVPAADLFFGNTNFGGCSLEKHWNVVKQCEELPEVKPYDFSRTGMEPIKATLREALVMEKWHFVTLQQASWLAPQLETFEPFFGNLYQLIRETAPQAQPVIHMTWSYRIDSPYLADNNLNQAEMFDRLCRSYHTMAEKYALPILPTGRAFQNARPELDYKIDKTFDTEKAKPYDLPDQRGSLNEGYHWETGNTASGNAELKLDPNHGNALGCYLGNAVWYERFTGLKIEDNPFCPEGVTAEELEILKKAAHAAVEEYGGSLV